MTTKRLVQKKICLLGDFAVGKTSLIQRYVEGRYDDNYLSTIGVKISRKTVERDDCTLNMVIWDLVGGEDFSKMGPIYLRGATAALIVCDLTRAETLESYHFYATQLLNLDSNAKLLFIGNKTDLETERQIEESELVAISDSFNAPYLATSAKTGFQVEEAFQQLAEQIEI